MGDESVNSTPEVEVVEYTFDLGKISLDAALDVLGYEPANPNPLYMANLVKSLRTCLVRGSKELTAADLPAIIEAFTIAIMGGDRQSKN